jgi:hypothetical protein
MIAGCIPLVKRLGLVDVPHYPLGMSAQVRYLPVNLFHLGQPMPGGTAKLV